MKYNFNPTTAATIDAMRSWVSNELLRVSLAVNTEQTAAPTTGTVKVETLYDQNIVVVAGSIAQNSSDKTKWDYVNDAVTKTVGVSGTQATASGTAITVNFDQTYTKCLSFVVSPDQTFAASHGITVGADAGLSSATIKASANFTGSCKLRWTGSSWTFIDGTDQDINPTYASYTNGVLVFTHDYCRGSALHADPYSDGGFVNPYLPVFQNASEQLTARLQWMDTTTGNLLTNSTPSNRMGAVFTKTNSGPLFLDGTQSATTINNTPVTAGNIYFMGLFQK